MEVALPCRELPIVLYEVQEGSDGEYCLNKEDVAEDISSGPIRSMKQMATDSCSELEGRLSVAWSPHISIREMSTRILRTTSLYTLKMHQALMVLILGPQMRYECLARCTGMMQHSLA